MSAGPTDAHLRRTYGISRGFYDALLAYQGGRCYVCHRKPARTPLGVDHDHRLPKGPDSVRGLLCVRSGRDSAGRDYPACNRIVGMARDNPAFFRRAADYLEHPPAQRLREQHESQQIQEYRECLSDSQDWDGEFTEEL